MNKLIKALAEFDKALAENRRLLKKIKQLNKQLKIGEKNYEKFKRI